MLKLKRLAEEIRNGKEFRRKIGELGFVLSENGYVWVKMGREKLVIFESLHGMNIGGMPRAAEFQTAQIAYLAAEMGDFSALVANYPRSVCDLNGSSNSEKSLGFLLNRQLQSFGIDEYKAALRGIFEAADDLAVCPLLIVSVHGMGDGKVVDIDVGSGNGENCDYRIASWFKERLAGKLKGAGYSNKVGLDKVFSAGSKREKLREVGIAGKKVQYLQIEISRGMRKSCFFQIAKMLAEVAVEYEQEDWRQIEVELDDKLALMTTEVYLLAGKGEKVFMDYRQRQRLGVEVGDEVELVNLERKVGRVRPAKREYIGVGKIGVSEDLFVGLGLDKGGKVRIRPI